MANLPMAIVPKSLVVSNTAALFCKATGKRARVSMASLAVSTPIAQSPTNPSVTAVPNLRYFCLMRALAPLYEYLMKG